MSVFYGNYYSDVAMLTRTKLYFIGTFGILCASESTHDVHLRNQCPHTTS